MKSMQKSLPFFMFTVNHFKNNLAHFFTAGACFFVFFFDEVAFLLDLVLVRNTYFWYLMLPLLQYKLELRIRSVFI